MSKFSRSSLVVALVMVGLVGPAQAATYYYQFSDWAAPGDDWVNINNWIVGNNTGTYAESAIN